MNKYRITLYDNEGVIHQSDKIEIDLSPGNVTKLPAYIHICAKCDKIKITDELSTPPDWGVRAMSNYLYGEFCEICF